MVDEPSEDSSTYVGDTAGGAGSSPTPEEEERGPAMGSALLLGIVLAFLIGWIPLVGALAVGLAGGWVSRSRIRGMYAMLLPGAICVGWFWFATYLYDIPFLTDLARLLVPTDVIFQGASALLFALLFTGQLLLCLLGGWIGGDIREHHDGRAGEWPRPA